MMNDVNERFNEVTFPLLILHGTDDKLCCASGSQRLYDTASSKNKVLKVSFVFIYLSIIYLSYILVAMRSTTVLRLYV